MLCLGPAFATAPASDIDGLFSFDGALVLPTPDLEKLRLEDSKAEGMPYRYGIQIPVSGLKSSDGSFGSWHKAQDGYALWSAKLVSPEAKSLDFHFSRLQLPEGSVMTLRGADKDSLRVIEWHEVAGDSFWSPYVLGDSASIEVLVPVQAKSEFALELGSVTHGYRGLFENAESMDKSGSCNVDVACNQGNDWHDQMRSVGQYTFSKSGSSYVCTGTLIANTGVTATPYFLTANHCLNNQTVASTVVVYWNYQGAQCRAPGSSASGTALNKSIASHSQSGATWRASHAPSDMTLLQLSSNVPAAASPFWSGWNRGTTAPSSSRGIHHPAGHEKRISIDNNAATVSGYLGASGSTHWRIGNWEVGTTEGGSSGSGLWDQNKRLIGQLHGGYAACGNTREDYYGRFSVSWTGGGTNSTRLSNWLDPGNTGATTRNGYSLSSFYQNITNYTINDNATVEAPISISNRSGSAPSALRVNVRINHTYIGDLKVDLIAPNGTVHVLHNRTGGSADNIFQTYTVNASASTANGTWKLRVNDNASGDTGIIDAWSLQF